MYKYNNLARIEKVKIQASIYKSLDNYKLMMLLSDGEETTHTFYIKKINQLNKVANTIKKDNYKIEKTQSSAIKDYNKLYYSYYKYNNKTNLYEYITSCEVIKL